MTSNNNCHSNCYLLAMFLQLQKEKQKLKQQKKTIDPNFKNGKFVQYTLLLDN